MQKPKARDRAAASGERIFASVEHPAQMGAAHQSLDALLPVLYLRGISAGDFQEALAALLGQGSAQPFPQR